MNEKDLSKINHVLEMVNNIDDIVMEEIIEEFQSKQGRESFTDLHFSSAYHMQNILNSFNTLVEIYYLHKDI